MKGHHRGLRLAVLAVLGSAIILHAIPRAIYNSTDSAVVNAPVITLRSPMEGHITQVFQEPGTPVGSGQLAVQLLKSNADDRYIRQLQSRLTELDSSEAAIADRIERLGAIRDRLAVRFARFKAEYTERLAIEAREINARIDGAQARLKNLTLDYDRSSELSQRMVSSRKNVEAAAALVSEKTSEIQMLRAQLDSVALRRSALETNTLVDLGGADTPYSAQRQDELDMQRAALEQERATLRAQKVTTARILEGEQAFFAAATQVSLASSVTGVVWRSSSQVGRPVLPGDELVEVIDCEARFIEARLNSGLLSRIKVGDTAEIRIAGLDPLIQAPVTSVLGVGARFDHPELAAQDDAPNTYDFKVIIRLPPEVLDFRSDPYCHVGRAASVSFPRELPGVGRLVGTLKPLLERVTATLFTSTDVAAGSQPEPAIIAGLRRDH